MCTSHVTFSHYNLRFRLAGPRAGPWLALALCHKWTDLDNGANSCQHSWQVVCRQCACGVSTWPCLEVSCFMLATHCITEQLLMLCTLIVVRTASSARVAISWLHAYYAMLITCDTSVQTTPS
jgi:hypothetical protein